MTVDPAGLLFTDQYQLAMGQVYFDAELHTRRARFEYFFRRYPDYGGHRAGFCVFAGLGPLLGWMESARITAGDLAALREQSDRAGRPRFSAGYLEWLGAEANFSDVEVRAAPEGSVIHAGVPVLTAEGPLAALQLLETPLLNRLNYPTLIATKAARVALAARGRPVLEFGMRRGPVSGASAGTRAALIGGAAFSSNVADSMALGLDPKGTHAHSMVQAFMATGEGELDAFRAFAAAHPSECILLLDTIDTLESGLPNAITVFRELRAGGHEPVGVRLDSGDLGQLAVAVGAGLDEAGFPAAGIVLSSDLDEAEISRVMEDIERASAAQGLDAAGVIARLSFGVGTRLITSRGASALGGVFKLVAVEHEGSWSGAGKRSNTAAKAVAGGRKSAWRAVDSSGTAQFDVVGPVGELPVLPDAPDVELRPITEVVFRDGTRTDGHPGLDDLRARCRRDLEQLPEASRDLVDPARYPVIRVD